MANRVTLTKLQEGPRSIIVHAYFESDGASGDLINYVLLDPATEQMFGNTRFSVQSVVWAFNGFSANLHFQELVDGTLIWVLPPDSGNEINFEPYGGLMDTSGPDGTGVLQLTTTGFSSLGDAGSIIIKVILH